MRWMPQVPRTLLISAALVCSGWPAFGQSQFLLGLERTDSLSGRWTEVFMSPEMMTNGKIAGGAVTNGTGFWRMKVEVVPSNTPAGPSRYVPRESATIQAAVDALTNGGTVYISPGVYSNPVTITGKVVNLVGITNQGKPVISGTILSNRTDFAAMQGLINYGPNAGGSVMNMVVMGGDTGIRGFTSSDPRALPPNVTLSNVSIGRSVRGVAGSFSDLKLYESSIVNAAAHGISVSNVNAAAVFCAYTYLHGCGEAGLRVISNQPTNKPTSVVITNSTFSGNQDGGAILIGTVSVLAFNSKFIGNGNAGFWCNNLPTTNNLFWNCQASFNVEDPGNNTGIAEGLVFLNGGTLRITLSEFIGNKRSGFTVYTDQYGTGPTTVIAGASVSSGNRFGVVDFASTFTDIGGNDLTGNTELNFLTDGDLPIPGPPPIPEE